MSAPETDSAGSISELAFQDTLQLLDWPILCEHLSTFASTNQGYRECKRLNLPDCISESCTRLNQTIEISDLDSLIEGGLSFEGVHDLDQILLLCFKGGVVAGEDLLKVADTLAAARRLRRQIDEPELRPAISALLVNLATLPELEKVLKFGLEEGGRIADRASPKLAQLRLKRQGMREERRSRLQEMLRLNSSILQDTSIGDRNGRPVLSVKATAIDQLLGVVQGSSASGNTVFLEPHEVIALGNKIAVLEKDILQEERRLLAFWCALVSENFSSLAHLSEVMLKLDLALARARYGNWLGAVPPTLHQETDAPFVFTELRHPLLVWEERKNQGRVVVPVSIEITSQLRVVAITGPNTGGKTVTLKSVGLAVLMARAGLFVPCSGIASLPWCNQVLADIGDEQSLQQNLSTFSSHISRISRILEVIKQTAGPTLVLLDEVGAGTDPTEGTALAIGLLRTLANRARLTIATTHFGELKSLKYSDSRFENASVAFDSETITPTYHLQWGIPGRSNALEIAKRLGLDHVITDIAQELIGPNGLDETNKVIRGLEEQRKRQQVAAEEAAALLARTELLHEELLDRWEKQCRDSAEVEELRRRKIAKSIRDGQTEVRALIKRLREEGADGETARKVGQSLRQMERDLQPDSSRVCRRNWLPKVGENVRVLALGKVGEVLSISEDGLQLNVLCGLFRSTLALDSVESLDGRKPSSPETVIKVQSAGVVEKGSNVRTARNTLDVRGLRVHEAEVAVEERLRHSNGPLWVIHGIGSGKLKKGLREWLRSVNYVERCADAEQKDGGPGCTVIWLA